MPLFAVETVAFFATQIMEIYSISKTKIEFNKT